MKNIYFTLILLFTGVFYGQDFDKNWKTVYQYELDGKIKSAQEEVQDIYKKAKRKKEEVQIIKCFFYLSKFEQVFDEKAQTTIVANLKNEIKDAKPASRAILNYIYGSILQNYYNNNHYSIRERTDLEKQKSTDFLTWTEKDFSKEIENAYSESMEKEKILHETFIDSYKDIFEISPFTDAKNYSLYDFLTEKSIAYYKTKINNWTHTNKPENNESFKTLYQDSKGFVDLQVDKFSDENLKKLLKLFQKNENYFREHNPEKADLAYYERIKYIYLINSNNDLYYKTLISLEKKTANIVLKQRLRLDRAQFYSSNASKESEVNFYNKALSLIDTIFTAKINPNVLSEAETLKNNITRKTLQINFHETIYPNENTRAFINFKNVDSIKISYYRFPVKNNEWLDFYNIYSQKTINRDSIIIAFKNKNIPAKSFIRALPKKTDYFEYSTEILLEKMDLGNYLVFIEAKNDTLSGSNAYTFGKLTVTNFMVIEDADDKNNLLYVLNRKTGKPIAGVEITSENETIKTNNLGKVTFKKLDYNKNKKYQDQIRFLKDNDTLLKQYHRDFIYDEGNNDDQYDHFEAKAMVYFDRGIYRPGQKMYYKGILIQKRMI